MDPKHINAEYELIILSFMLLILKTIFTMGMMFVYQSIKTTNSEIKLKGKLIILLIIFKKRKILKFLWLAGKLIYHDDLCMIYGYNCICMTKFDQYAISSTNTKPHR